MVALGIVALILLALTLDFFVESLAWRMRARAPLHAGRDRQLPAWLSRSVPLGFLVDPAHVWLHREEDHLLRLGGDGFATAVLGNPDSVELLAREGAVVRGQPLAVLARKGRGLTLRSPVSGSLVEYNTALSPEDAAKDPFGRGWFVTLRPDRPLPEESMHKADRLRAFMADEWERLRTFVMERARASAPAGLTMADGGPLKPGFLPHLAEPDRVALEEAFFGIAPVETGPGLSAREGTRR